MNINDILPPSPLDDDDLAAESKADTKQVKVNKDGLASRQSAWQAPWSSNALFQVARPSAVPAYGQAQSLRSRPVVNLP